MIRLVVLFDFLNGGNFYFHNDNLKIEETGILSSGPSSLPCYGISVSCMSNEGLMTSVFPSPIMGGRNQSPSVESPQTLLSSERLTLDAPLFSTIIIFTYPVNWRFWGIFMQLGEVSTTFSFISDDHQMQRIRAVLGNLVSLV